MRGREGSTRDRRDEMLRKPPPQLLDDLEGVGLGPFGVIAPQVDVGEPPPVPIADLGTQSIDVVVRAIDRDDLRPANGRTCDLARLQRLRDEDVTLQAKTRGMRSHAVPKISRRRTPEDLVAKLDGPCRCHRDDAIFVRQRRMIDRIVLDIQLAQPELLCQPISAYQGREAGVKPGARLAHNRPGIRDTATSLAGAMRSALD